MLHSFLGLFQFVHAVFQCSRLHLFRFLHTEIVHQSSKLAAIVLAGIHVDEVLLVPELLAVLADYPVDMGYRKSVPQCVFQRDEYHVGFRELIEVLSRIQHVGIHHPEVVSGTFRVRSLIVLLYLDVEDASASILCHTVQHDTSAMHVSEIHLRLIVDDGQILVLHDDSKNVLAGFLILEYIPRENIAHHGQILNRFLVSLLMLKHRFFLIHR